METTIKVKLPKIVLAVTGVLMLALAVLPHHHHGGHDLPICFSFSLTRDADHIHHAHEDGAGCNHSDGETDCDLRGIFVMAGREDNDTCTCGEDNDSHRHDISDHFFVQLFIALNTDGDLQSEYKTPLYKLSFEEPLRQDYILSVRAFRAPPFFIA